MTKFMTIPFFLLLFICSSPSFADTKHPDIPLRNHTLKNVTYIGDNSGDLVHLMFLLADGEEVELDFINSNPGGVYKYPDVACFVVKNKGKPLWLKISEKRVWRDDIAYFTGEKPKYQIVSYITDAGLMNGMSFQDWRKQGLSPAQRKMCKQLFEDIGYSPFN